MSKASTALALVIVIALVGVAGYVFVAHGALPFGSTPSSSNPGTLNVYVKDTEANWTHVNVTFSSVQVHPANDTNESDWKTITLKETTVDLASLKNVSELLGTASLSPGMYTQIRINVTAATGVMSNGTKVNFTVPSGVLRTDQPFNVTSGGTTGLTIDIDLARSIVDAAGVWYFTPVLGSVQMS